MDIKLFGDKMVPPSSVEGLAGRIFMCSVIGANELKRTSEKVISRPAWLSIVFEYLFFYVALAKRHSWNHLPPERLESLAAKVSDVLITAVVNYVFEDGEASANAARVDRFKVELAVRMEEYEKFAVMVRESQSEKPEGTGLWAFCKTTAALSGSPDDVVCIMVTHGHIHDSMIAIGMEAPDWIA